MKHYDATIEELNAQLSWQRWLRRTSTDDLKLALKFAQDDEIIADINEAIHTREIAQVSGWGIAIAVVFTVVTVINSAIGSYIILDWLWDLGASLAH